MAPSSRAHSDSGTEGRIRGGELGTKGKTGGRAGPSTDTEQGGRAAIHRAPETGRVTLLLVTPRWPSRRSNNSAQQPPSPSSLPRQHRYGGDMFHPLRDGSVESGGLGSQFQFSGPRQSVSRNPRSPSASPTGKADLYNSVGCLICLTPSLSAKIGALCPIGSENSTWEDVDACVILRSGQSLHERLAATNPQPLALRSPLARSQG